MQAKHLTLTRSDWATIGGFAFIAIAALALSIFLNACGGITPQEHEANVITGSSQAKALEECRAKGAAAKADGGDYMKVYTPCADLADAQHGADGGR